MMVHPVHAYQMFISLYLKAFIKKLVQIGNVVSETIRFDLDLRFSNTFIYPIR